MNFPDLGHFSLDASLILIEGEGDLLSRIAVTSHIDNLPQDRIAYAFKQILTLISSENEILGFAGATTARRQGPRRFS